MLVVPNISKPLEPLGNSLSTSSSRNANLPDLNSLVHELNAEARSQIARRTEQARRSRLSSANLNQAIPETIPRLGGVSLVYQIRLLVVALAMALLPLTYVAIVLTFAVGVCLHVRNIPGLLSDLAPGTTWLNAAIIICSPAIVGAILVLFMIKPLFFRRWRDERRRSLTRKAEPLVYEFVDRICHAVGAPKPSRIDVDYQVNASALIAGGYFGLFNRKLVLTIGVPLVAGLSARGLAGVLAHEFGHFSQRYGMGSVLMIRKVNRWFHRVVYQKDWLDDVLDEWIEDWPLMVTLVFRLARVCVALTRGILWLLMMTGCAISASLMRQMEFDADRYAYGLMGSEPFRSTSRELHLMAATQSLVVKHLGILLEKGTLVDDMVLLLEQLRRHMPDSLQRTSLGELAHGKTRWLDTHPSTAARIAKADRAKAPGHFRLDRPARELVQHYEALCKNVSVDFYRDYLNSIVRPKQLTSTKEFLSQLDSLDPFYNLRKPVSADEGYDTRDGVNQIAFGS